MLISGGLIIGWFFSFKGRWVFNIRELINDGGGAYEQQLTVSIYMFTDSLSVQVWASCDVLWCKLGFVLLSVTRTN